MIDSSIFALVDHTLLSPTATWEDIKSVCNEAIQYSTASVCIPPSFVKQVSGAYGTSLNICTVIGFPLGYATTESKIAEIIDADTNGANEFDVVINQGDVKDGNFDKITSELTALKKAIGSKVLKVIIECCNLTDGEKVALCDCVTKSNADYIKTSTGFGTGGATLADIKLFKQHIGQNVKIKAAGGMKTKDDFIAFINEGCARLGTSSAVKVLTGQGASGY